MKKFLIKSIYHYYDDNVCICDSKEKAEELVQQFETIKKNYKSTIGCTIYYYDDQLEEFFKNITEYNLIVNDLIYELHRREDCIVIFIKEENLWEFNDIIKIEPEIKENCSLLQFKCNLFEDEKPINERKFLNHEDARLSIEEIDYI